MNSEFFIVLHKNTSIYDVKKVKPKFNAQVIIQSHITNDFYYEKMPLLIKDEVTFEEVVSGFFDSDEETKEKKLLNKKLTFLHQLLGGNFDKSELEKYENEYDFKYDNNEHIESIREIRDTLLNKVT